jgi:2-methylcitrate dehydratase
MSGLAAAAMTGWLLRLPAERLGHALALAATHCATLGEVRVGKISAAKSFASAIVVQTAALLTLLAADGMTGPERALDGRRGFGTLILDGVDLEGFFTAAGDDRLLSAGLKPYPCLVLGQGPVDAALELRCRVPKPERIERLTLALADTGPARLRLLDPHGRAPESSEAADHSLYFLVAVAVLDGRFGLDQIRGGRWRDRDVRALMDRIEATIDPGLAPKTALPCRIEAALADGGRCIVARPLTPGSVANPLSWEEVVEKFRRCAEGVLGAAAQDRVIGYIADIERLPSARLLAEGLAADAP